MNNAQQNAAFAGPIPLLYEQCLGPVIFAPYADDLTARILARMTWFAARMRREFASLLGRASSGDDS